MRKIFLLGLVLVCAEIARAVVIEQIYPNPAGTESGGEAVMLYNTRNSTVLLENWTLATQASLRDVVFPQIMIEPGQKFLVADTGWSTKKDDAFWRDADLEETLTLGNENGGVALVDDKGSVIDAVGWGNIENTRLFKGTPAPMPSEKKVLLRKSNTGNNEQDFIVSEPEFEPTDAIMVVLTVANNTISVKEIVLLPDESAKEGVQIMPAEQKKITVRVLVDGSLDGEIIAKLANQTIELQQLNESAYEGTFALSYSFPAGNHTIQILAGNTNSSAKFEYLPFKKISIPNKQVMLASVAGKRATGEVLLQNQGNTRISLQTLLLGNNSLDIKVSLDGMIFLQPNELSVTLAPGETRKVFVGIDVPRATNPGTYKTRLRFKEMV